VFGFLAAREGSRAMSNYQAELNKVSKTVQKQMSETEEKIGEIQNEFAKTIDVINRAAMSRATAEIELGLKLSQKLSIARSPADALLACQEWLTEEMKARTEDTRQYMTTCQRFIAEGTRLFSNGGSNGRLSR
jgi:uncharacterized protein (UPF0128 family)